MPNNSRRSGSAGSRSSDNTYTAWLSQFGGSNPFEWSTPTSVSSGRTRGQASPPPSEPEPEVVHDEVEQDDTSFALSAGSHEHSIPTFQPAPRDPMVPHESDTAAVRSMRAAVVAGEDGSGNLRSVLGSLCVIARGNWERQMRGETEPQAVSRRSRSRGLFGSAPGVPESTQTFFGNVPETANMATIAQSFGMRVNYPTIEKHPFIVGTNLAGVEIELENLNIEHPSFDYWTAKGDGSLRNGGMEFVCSHPWGGIDLYNAALEIDSFLFNNNPEDTWRCSTHVHIDVRDLTVAQLKKMILAYVFYERVLFKCSGWHRYKNNFCVALGFAQGQIDDLGNWWCLPDSQFVSRLTRNWDKYTAINFLPMASFGSVEFRISEAKWHKGQLIRLVNRFLSLKELAVERSELSDEDFVNSLVQEPIANIIKKGVPRGMGDVASDLEFGYKMAYEILSMAKLRRRSRRLFVPNVEDGSRVMQNCAIFQNGWSHCRSHLITRYPDLEFPTLEELGTTLSFSWIYELEKMMRRHRLTFEVVWFMPEQNREQLKRLYRTYRAERNAVEGDVTPEEAPIPQAEPAEWYDDSEDSSDYDEED